MDVTVVILVYSTWRVFTKNWTSYVLAFEKFFYTYTVEYLFNICANTQLRI